MKRYHFKTDEQSDVKGMELADLAAVKCEAAKVAGSIVCAAADDAWQRREWAVTVTDDFGVKVLELRILGTQGPSQPSAAIYRFTKLRMSALDSKRTLGANVRA